MKMKTKLNMKIRRKEFPDVLSVKIAKKMTVGFVSHVWTNQNMVDLIRSRNPVLKESVQIMMMIIKTVIKRSN